MPSFQNETTQCIIFINFRVLTVFKRKMFLNFIIKSYKITSAIQENPTHSLVFQVIIMTGDVLLLGGLISALFQATEMTYFTTVLAIFLCVCFACSLKNLSKMYEKLLLRIMSKVLCTYPDIPNFIDKKITEKAEVKTERNWGVELIMALITISFCLYCPYFYLITKPGISLEHPDLQVIPYFHSYWDTKTMPHYLSKRFFEIVVSISSMVGYMNFTAFMVYLITNVELHVEEINRLLSNAITRRVKKHMKFEEFNMSQHDFNCYMFEGKSNFKKQEYLKDTEEDFIEMVKYHQFVHSYMKDITRFLEKPFNLLVTWYISSTILFIYVFLQVTNDYIFLIKILSLAIHGTIALHLYCSVAEIIHRMNELLMDSFYNTSWYYLLPKTRKNFLLTLILCQRKYQLKYFGMYVGNLGLFIYALRIVYSIVNIIRANGVK